MTWLLSFAVVAGIAVGLRYKAPAVIAASIVVICTGIWIDLGLWQIVICFMALQLAYFAAVLTLAPRR